MWLKLTKIINMDMKRYAMEIDYKHNKIPFKTEIKDKEEKQLFNMNLIKRISSCKEGSYLTYDDEKEGYIVKETLEEIIQALTVGKII